MTAVAGRFVEASNATLLGDTAEGLKVVYKPVAGAAPLWDFDAATLAAREVWTYRIAQVMGLDIVPRTAMGDGLYGPGAVQLFVDAVADDAVIAMINRADSALWPFALLDAVINNADRKAGHVLRDTKSRLWGIDHGLTFHAEDKLRTVLWGFAGETIPGDLLPGLRQLGSQLDADLGNDFGTAFSAAELAALRLRVARLLESGCHPEPPEDRPAIPWPPY